MACLYGFLKEYRPSEAYLSAYLTGPWKNLTVEEVNNEVYPFWTYSYLVWLVPVFLLTDYLRYMPMLVVGGLAYVGTWALLLWAQGVLAMKFMQVIYGLATATEIGYFSYLFAMISNEHYKIITSFTRAAILVGRFVAYLTGQLLVSFDLMNYQQLNIISFIAKSLTKQRYGFVFGVNMFMALVVETILTVIVVDKAGLDVDVRTQVFQNIFISC
ncbi:thiamine transporter 1-like [Mytilus californianus]|uniref:thiamine transporter 1-like n=1 Tax=Mytilus californianus TaxID=6549 RepID=UPI0022459DB5|nr:thiamine transporter 1-like [Mytilus californianus]